MSATADTTYTEAEMAAYNEGYQARTANVDYLDSPYMRTEVRDLYRLCAWTAGWLAADAPALKSERLNELFGDADGSERCAELS